MDKRYTGITVLVSIFIILSIFVIFQTEKLEAAVEKKTAWYKLKDIKDTSPYPNKTDPNGVKAKYGFHDVVVVKNNGQSRLCIINVHGGKLYVFEQYVTEYIDSWVPQASSFVPYEKPHQPQPRGRRR
tara:strand:+ start:49094 stop:49477 length:384 start_codon:yes stop_codon:yes gene_type:complete